MIDYMLRKTIGSRAKARRKELGLSMDYMAEKLDVNKSTIQRYENGSIDNTKRLIVEGLANALFVSPEYLRGETDDYTTEVNDRDALVIRDLMSRVLYDLPLDLSAEEDEFAEKLLVLLLAEYRRFLKSYSLACSKLGPSTMPLNDEAVKLIGFSSKEEFSQIFFQKEIMHTVNTFYELSEILRGYAQDPQAAQDHLKAKLRKYNI